MSKETRQAATVLTAIQQRSSDLVDQYTADLDGFVNSLVPPFLDNAEYAARTSALMIALNRELARCAVAFGQAHEIELETMIHLVVGQFTKNLALCSDAIEGAGQTVQ